MMKKNKIFSIVLCLALLVSMLPSAAFAAPVKDHPFTIIFGTKAYDQMAMAKPELKKEMRQALIQAGNKFVWVRAGGKIVDHTGKMVDPATLPKNITLTKGDGTKVLINEGEEDLKVEEISLLDATHIKVQFNKKLQHTKLLKQNFTILDKNSKAIGDVAKATPVDKDGKTSVTLETPALEAGKAPYTLFVNKAQISLEPNVVQIVLPQAEPKILKVMATAGNEITVETTAALSNPSNAADVALKDLTDDTNTGTISSASVVAADKTKFKVTTNEASFFVPGHKYELTVNGDKLADTFGNKNKGDVTFEFDVEKNENAPKLTKAELVRYEDGDPKVAVHLTFDMPIKPKDPVVIDIVDKANFQKVTKSVANAQQIAPGADASAILKGVTKLPENELVLKDVAPAFGMSTQQMYTVELHAKMVTDTQISATPNEKTSAESKGVDVVAPKISAVVVKSAKEIVLTFDEKVTYTSAEVKVKGFAKDADSDTERVASVKMSEDGLTATLTPKTDGELFRTNADVTGSFDEGAFVDESENKIAALVTAVFHADTEDLAVPVAVVAKHANTNQITVTFTEDITTAVPIPSNVVVKDSIELEFDGGGAFADGKWTISSNKVQLKNAAPALAASDKVAIPAGVLKDTAAKANVLADEVIIIAQ